MTSGYENITWYVENESRLIISDKEYLFKRYRNGYLLHKYPNLLKRLGGDMQDYVDNRHFLDKQRKNNEDLRFCKYDSIVFTDSGMIHVNKYHGGFYSDGTSLYAAYQFEGDVVIYTGLWPFYRIEEMEDCECPYDIEPPREVIQFAILKDVDCVNQLSTCQQSMLGLKLAGVEQFLYVRCE